MLTQAIRIIGIDPGLRRTGWGIVESDGVRLSYVASGLVTSDGEGELAYRLREIYEGLCGVIARYRPQEAAVEETFVNKDARATLKLGQARGMALLAPASSGLKVAEYPPNVIKKTITGTGHGEKRQIAAMVGFLLPKARFDGTDEADALAIAICHANHRSVGLGQPRRKPGADPTQTDPTDGGRASSLKALGLRYRSTQPTRARRGT
jgi:crossover junction endodeoxyribonuclease RuvC